MVSVIKDHLWPPFCRMIGHPRLADDPTLKTGYQRRERAEEILRLAGEAFAKNTSDYWCAQMRELGILNEKVNGYDELFKHEQTKTMQTFTWSEQPGVGRVPHPNVPGPQPFAADEPRSKVPRIGEHTHTVMVDLGYSAVDIARMLDQAIVFEPKAA
jgi:itaconate CoA-transferase